MKKLEPPGPTEAAACRDATREQTIAAYAAEMGGTEFDLDTELEAASSELLFASEPLKARSRQ
jgi:hypothetical protein